MTRVRVEADLAVEDGGEWTGALSSPESVAGLEMAQQLFTEASGAPKDGNEADPTDARVGGTPVIQPNGTLRPKRAKPRRRATSSVRCARSSRRELPPSSRKSRKRARAKACCARSSIRQRLHEATSGTARRVSPC